MTITRLIIACSILFLSSCQVNVAGTDKNDEISQDVKSEISEQVDRIINSFKSQDVDDIASGFLNKESGINTMLDTVFALKMINENTDIQVLDELYVKSTMLGTNEKVSSVIHDYKYNFFFTASNFRSYIVFLNLDNPGSDCNILMSLIFTERNNKWLQQYMHLSPYTYDGKLAPDFSDLAYEQHMNKNIVGAYFLSSYASYIALPAGVNFHYQKEREMKNLYDMVVKKFNDAYSFPILVKDIATKPLINSLTPLIALDKAIPLPIIKYTSRVTDNESELQKEVDQLNAKMPTILPGLEAVADSIMYEVTYVENDNPKTQKIMRAFATKTANN